MATRVQSGTDDVGGLGNAIVNLSVTAGNLLVAVLSERSGDSADDHSVTDSTNTWTKRISMTTEQGDTNARRSFSVWTTEAGSTESLDVLGNFAGTPVQDKRLSVHEFAHSGDEDQWVFEEATSADTGTGSTSPLSTGTTATVDGGNFIAIACAMWRTQGTDIDGGSGISWDNSFTDEVTHGAGISNARCHSMAWKTSTSTAGYQSDVSWNGTGHEGNAGIIVIATEAAGGTPATVTPGVIARSLTVDAVSVAGAAVTTPAAIARSVTLPQVTAVGDPVFPDAPTNLTATTASSSQIDLAWDAVINATGYDIERDSSVIVTDHGTNSYSDTGLSASTLYTYRVRARRES